MSINPKVVADDNEAARRRGQLPGQQQGSMTKPLTQAPLTIHVQLQGAMYAQPQPQPAPMGQTPPRAAVPLVPASSSSTSAVAGARFGAGHGAGAPVAPAPNPGNYIIHPSGSNVPGQAPMYGSSGNYAAPVAPYGYGQPQYIEQRVQTSEDEASLRRKGLTSKTVVTTVTTPPPGY